jgi:hypothetical protein
MITIRHADNTNIRLNQSEMQIIACAAHRSHASGLWGIPGIIRLETLISFSSVDKFYFSITNNTGQLEMERQELIKFLNEFGLWFELLRNHDGPCQSVMIKKIALK